MKRIDDPFAPTPEGFHLRVEQTLNGLEEKEMTRRKFTVGLAVALAVLLMTTAAGYAVVSGGYVGWDGIFHLYTDEGASSAIPDENSSEPATPAALDDIPEGEYWQISQNGNLLSSAIRHICFYDVHEIRGLLSQSQMPAPAIPTGFSITEFSIGTEPESAPYEESLLWNGTVLSKHRLTPVNPASADNYYFLLKDEDGLYITINAWLGEVSYDDVFERFHMDVSGDGEYGAVEIEGFDNALYVDDNDGIRWLRLLKQTDRGNLSIDVTADSTVPKDALLTLFSAHDNDAAEPDNPPLDIRPDDKYVFELERTLAHELLHAIPEGECWRINRTVPAGAYISTAAYPQVDFSEAVALTSEASLPLPEIPDGFSVSSIKLLTPTENTPYEETPLETGAVFQKYRLMPVSAETILGYTLTLTNADGAEILIAADPDGVFSEGEAISIEGFDQASYFSSDFLGVPELHEMSLRRIQGGHSLVVSIYADSLIPKALLLSLF